MYIIIEHEISDPKAFFETAQASMPNLPSRLKLHQVFPSADGSKAVCLWEAAGLHEVRDYVEESVGRFSKNTYFAVEAENAVGLPSIVRA